MAKPQRTKVETTTLTIRLPVDLHEQLLARASEENRTITNLIYTYLSLVKSHSTEDLRTNLNGRRRRSSNRPRQ
jgi:hypothetical protein